MLNLVGILSACAGFAVFFLYAGLFEYAFHRWVLLRPLRVLPYPYQVHALLHHQVFRGDVTYHVQRKEDRDVILFHWWQAPLLLTVHVPLAWGIQIASGFPVCWSGMTALAV